MVAQQINPVAVVAAFLSVCAFAWTYGRLRSLSASLRLGLLLLFGGLSIPALLFAVYYSHILPEWAWLYTLRSWRGSELLAVFLGIAGGVSATFLPRLLMGVPLFVCLAVIAAPYVKPIVFPLPDSAFHESWRENVCLQSTSVTCGPACVSTILRQFGVCGSEQEAARACYTYGGGTEAWYLARYIRAKGLSPRFRFEKTFSTEAGLPAVVGVRMGGAGHFIAVLGREGDAVVIADPLCGKERIPLSSFCKRYQFTGFHMVITRD